MMKKLFLSTLLLSVLVVPTLVLAQATQGTPSQGSGTQGTPSGINGSIPNPFRFCEGNDCGLMRFVMAIINNIIMPVGGVLAVIGFIISGFLFVVAQGDQKKLEQAKRAITYTVIGTIILFGAVGLSNIIVNTINSIRTS